ncbi:MAG: ATP-binding protein, partial [Nocardioidaceae bacterium]
EALLAEDPLHEARWRLLGVALYRAHRQADALAAVRRARELLAEELGVDPGPGLRTLEAELLAQSPSLDAPQPAPVAVPEVLLPEVPVAAEEAAPAASAEDLVDREQELRRLRACFDEAMAGRPRVAVIEGPAGIGKSRLLQEVRQRAAARGATVLSARGSQLEREFGFGAVRQLFEPALAGGPDGLLVGAAAAAGRVFDVGVGETPRGESLFSALHGLYWMTVTLAERGPLVLAVDDVQWCDSGSLRFLGYLARRLGGLRLLVVATLRSGEQHVEEDLLHDLAGDAEVLRPSPLTLAGVSGLVHARLPGADEAFVGACFRTTGGNPLLLRQLLSALEAEHVRPDASHADTVRAIGSRAVSSLVLMRLGRLPVAARDVARAVSVLGDGASLPAVAALTGLGEPETARATATLARADVLRPDLPLGFVHPLVGDAVYGDLPLGERELMHERAARVLTDAGASAEQVAAHLMLVPARGDDGVVEVLREAAARDVARGATEGAIAYLLRAVAEPPAPEDLPLLLLDLGRLESMVDGPAAA